MGSLALAWRCGSIFIDQVKLPDRPQEKGFSREQKDAWEKMRSLLSNSVEADRKYNRLKPSYGGRIISTDIARHLDTRYAQKPKAGQLRDIKPGWDLAWRYAQDRMMRELESRGKRKLVRFMAGGWAAGKTHALRHETTRPDLVWDGTLGEPVWAASMIEIALQKGWKVEVAYIYRNLELAFYGAMQRAKEEGRAVPLERMASNHRVVQQSIIKLSEVFLGRKGISFLYIHNLGKKGALADPLKIELKELEYNGALHYLEKHEHYYSEAAKHLSEDYDA